MRTRHSPVVIVKTEGQTYEGAPFINLQVGLTRLAGTKRALEVMFGDDVPEVQAVTVTVGARVTDVYTRMDGDTVVHDNRLADRMTLLNDSNMDVGLS